MAHEDASLKESDAFPRIKFWNAEQHVNIVTKSRISIDGRFIGVISDDNRLAVAHLKENYEEIISQETKNFVWGLCDWKEGNSLSYPTEAAYLTAVDKENNITVFTIQKDQQPTQYSSSMLTLIGSSLFSTLEEISDVHDVALLTAFYSVDGSKHQILCLVNNLYFVELVIPSKKEPHIGISFCVCERRDNLGRQDEVILHVYREDLIYLFSEEKILYIVSSVNFQILKKINLFERLLLYDVRHIGVYGGDKPTLVLVDDTNQLHFVKLLDLWQEHHPSEKKWSNLWTYRINETNQKYKQKSRKLLNDYTANERVDISLASPLERMKDYVVNEIKISKTCVLLMYVSRGKVEKTKYFAKYDYNSKQYFVKEILEDVCLSFNDNDFYPTLFISSSVISISIYPVSQEQLIDTIIQYSDIAQAEVICKSNEWNQFSIPLHTLEVGLQHRQLDTISFFLKSREKVFTRYWKNLNDASPTGSGSFSKSFSSQKSYSELIDSDEMVQAIEMLVKAVHSNSRGKHKQNFFEELLQISLKYLNKLLQDGIVAIDLKSASNSSSELIIDTCSRSKSMQSTQSLNSGMGFAFLFDISDALNFITKKIIELRAYLRHPSAITKPKDKQINTIDVTDGGNQKMSEGVIEAYLMNGKVSALQKLFYTQSGPSKGNFSIITQYGLGVVMKLLKLKQVENAEKILLNLGLVPNEELKCIYVKTFERNLRNYLFDVLKNKDMLNEEDKCDYSFVIEVEQLYSSNNFQFVSQKHRSVWQTKLKLSLPSPLTTNFTDFNGKPDNVNNRKEINEFPKDAYECYCELSLQYIKLWNVETRKKVILDGIFMRDATVTLLEKDNNHIWKYLLSHDQMPAMELWIKTLTNSDTVFGNQIFPKLTDELVMNFETATSYSKECLLNELVKNGFYPACIMDDFPVLIHYFSQNKILFNGAHPMVHYKRKISDDERKELIDDFNMKFLCFCEDNDLVMLAFYFISYYRLMPKDFNLNATTKSWLAMMMYFYKASMQQEYLGETLLETNPIFEAFLHNYGFSNRSFADGSITLNDMVKDNQPVTALAIALVSNISFDKILQDGENGSIYKIEKKLLEQQLRMFPKLHAALFNSPPDDDNSDISLYRLLQDNTEVDISKWFGWQSLNEVVVREENILTEMPHFSNPFLVKRYAQEVKLTYDYYLKQGRPMCAYLVYLTACERSAEWNSQSEVAAEDAYKLAIENFLSSSITSSCALFVELIDVDCDKIKIDCNAALLISRNWNKKMSIERKYTSEEMKNLLVHSFLQEKNYQHLLRLLEDSIEVAIYENKINRFSYQAVCHWQLAIRFCRIHNIPLSTRYADGCCREENWLQFILFIHFHQIPPEQVISILKTSMKNEILQEHLIAIIKNSREVSVISYEEKKRRKKSKESKEFRPSKEAKLTEKAHPRDIRAQFYSRLGTVTTKETENQQPLTSTPTKNEKSNEYLSAEDTVFNSVESFIPEMKIPNLKSIPNNIVDIVLDCEGHSQPSAMLLLHALVLYHPLLPVLAGCYEECNYVACLCIWYICGVEDHLKLHITQKLLAIELKFQDISLALQSHSWQQDDLLIIVECLLTEGVKYCKLVSQGFIIFKQTDILKYVLQFIESFLYNESSSHILKSLERFQSEYETHKNQKVIGKQFSSDEDLHYCEAFSYKILMLMLKRCPSQYHVFKLVAALADSKYGHMFSIKVPDFVLVKKTAEIIYKTNIKCSLEKLCVVKEEIVHEEIKEIFTVLLNTGHFDEAYAFASLHELSESLIMLHKTNYELKNIITTDAWCNVEVRCAFWNEANENFVKSTCDNMVAGSFFKEQALLEPSRYLYEERASLTLLAMKWYSIDKTEETSDVINKLEKNVWFFKIKSHVNEDADTMTHAMLRFCANTSMLPDRRRTCSDITLADDKKLTELLQKEELLKSFQRYPTSSLNGQEEEVAYEKFLGKLLDDNQITEARRVAGYFTRSSMDLEIVLTAILLAQGKQNVDTLSDNLKEILAETTSRHISISGILERSGSFTRPGSLNSHPTGNNTSGCMVDFVFIEEIQNALEKLTLRVNHGKKCCQQVLISFKIAQILSLSYEEVVTDDHFFILRRLLDSSFDQRRQLAKQFIKAFDLSPEEVGTFIAETMINWIKLACGEDLTASGSSSPVATPSYEDIISLVQLTDNSSLIGNQVLQEAVKLEKAMQPADRSGANLIYEVELLIHAHYCFTITCDMEGIAGVLRAARHCTKSLAKINQHNLMVRLLTGIGRFREMFYVIETLYNHHHFEILCRRGIAKENQLKIALLDFMKRYHPEDIENFNMISLGFGMYREFAQHLETTGNAEIKTLKAQLKGSGKDLIPALKAIGRTFSYAADNYVKDECLRQAQRCHRIARLTELQIQLLPLEYVVLGLTAKEVQTFLNQHLSFIEAFIVADSYEMRDISLWVEPLYQIVVIKGQFMYLQQFQAFLPLSPSLVIDIAHRFRSEKSVTSSTNMKKLLNRLTDLKTKLKISKELSFIDLEKQLLEGSSGAYLRDHMF